MNIKVSENKNCKLTSAWRYNEPLMYCVGHFSKYSEVNTTLTYADYYFPKVLRRYNQWVLKEK